MTALSSVEKWRILAVSCRATASGRRKKNRPPDMLPIALSLFAEVQRKLLELQEMREFCGRRGRAARFGCGLR
jgi:hypothetical protein